MLTKNRNNLIQKLFGVFRYRGRDGERDEDPLEWDQIQMRCEWNEVYGNWNGMSGRR